MRRTLSTVVATLFALAFVVACTGQPAAELAPDAPAVALDDDGAVTVEIEVSGLFDAFILVPGLDPINCCINLIEGEIEVPEGVFDGEEGFLLDAVSLSPSGAELFPDVNIFDAERLFVPSCVTVIDERTVMVAGENFNVGTEAIFPPGLWFASLFEDRDDGPDRAIGYGAGDRETMIARCLDPETTIATVEPDQLVVATTGELEISIEFDDEDDDDDGDEDDDDDGDEDDDDDDDDEDDD